MKKALRISGLLGVLLWFLSSCVGFTANAIAEPALDDESFLFVFISDTMVGDGFHFGQISPALIGPLPTDSYATKLHGVEGSYYVLANVAMKGIYTISSGIILRGRLFVDLQLSTIDDGTIPIVKVDRPGFYYFGTYSLRLEDEHFSIVKNPGITERQALEGLVEIIKGNPTWLARLNAYLKGGV